MVTTSNTKVPVFPYAPLSTATSVITLKINAPIKVDRAYWERSSEIISGNARGVAELLAEWYAETMEVTASVAITSILEDSTFSRVITESRDTLGSAKSGNISSA